MERNTEHENKKDKKTGVDGKPNYGNQVERNSFHHSSEVRNYYDRRMGDEINYEDLEDMWYEIEDSYRSRYPKLTDDDVIVEPGRFDRTIDRIGRRIEKSPDDVSHEIDNW